MDLIDGYVPIRWPDRRRGPFYAQVRMVQVGGRFEVVGLAVGSVKDDIPITGTVLRRIRVNELAKDAADLLRQLDVSSRLEAGPLVDNTDQNGLPLDDDFFTRREAFWAPGHAAAEAERAALAAVPAAPPRPSDEEIARIYEEAFRLRQPPTRAVARALGISTTAAAKRVWRIRKTGLLPETGQGRAAGRARRGRKQA